ncbi:MAG: polyprenyl synthetase family protein [Pseudomonadales bacterium]|nr:polyprenyl synthetase family protein [Pseudomonadales bacterium]
MLSFHLAVKEDFEAVNGQILAQLHSNVDLVENIGHYIIEAGGKRLRPLLVLLVANSLKTTSRAHIDLAVIIEFIHTATLLHDDVVDLSELRRNRPTANAKWGNAPSVLVGDFLYSRAFQMMVRLGSMDVMDILSEATNIIAEGEVLQLVNAGDANTTEQRYLDVINYKTAKLFEAAAEIGAIAANASREQRLAFKKFGHHLGMAFQLMDDILDYTGDMEKLGKNIGDDLSEGKPTLPLIYAMQNSSLEQKNLIAHAITDKTAENFLHIANIVQSSGALKYCKTMADKQIESALEALTALPDSVYKTELCKLARFSVSRSF